MAREEAHRPPGQATGLVPEPDPPVRVRSHAIGCIGAGMIMADVQLVAYREAGFPVVAIASRNPAHASAVAARHGIGTVHRTPRELIADERVEIVDIAFPPDRQPELVRLALRQPHVKAVLAQKPLALTLAEAVALRDEAAATGTVLSVNQNMRYDQSVRVLGQLLEAGILGDPVFASIDMRAVPHWQGFLAGYERLTIANMSVHHLDALRYLFGEAVEISTMGRPDPRTAFPHSDGIVVSSIRFASGVLASSIEDVWAGPRSGRAAPADYIRWRVEGTDGIAEGTLGWSADAPSTLRYMSPTATVGEWITPTWTGKWFPQAFIGVMEQLQFAVETGREPALSIDDNLRSLALVEAAYRSLREARVVRLSEFDDAVGAVRGRDR